MPKKALKGFSAFSVFPVTTDTTSAYAVGEQVPMAGAQSLTKDDKRSDYSVNADDGTYDSGSEYESTEIQVTLAEMDLDNLAAVNGATYTSADKLLKEYASDVAPTVALSFRGLRSDGGYRLFHYLCAKLTNYKHDMASRGQNKDVSAYTLTFSCIGRACDALVRETKDVDVPQTGTIDLTWLDTIAAVPVVSGQ